MITDRLFDGIMPSNKKPKVNPLVTGYGESEYLQSARKKLIDADAKSKNPKLLVNKTTKTFTLLGPTILSNKVGAL